MKLCQLNLRQSHTTSPRSYLGKSIANMVFGVAILGGGIFAREEHKVSPRIYNNDQRSRNNSQLSKQAKILSFGLSGLGL